MASLCKAPTPGRIMAAVYDNGYPIFQETESPKTAPNRAERLRPGKYQSSPSPRLHATIRAHRGTPQRPQSADEVELGNSASKILNLNRVTYEDINAPRPIFTNPRRGNS